MPATLSPLVTLASIFALGFCVSLIGDACHVSSGTTEYLLPQVPNLWRSAVWFPFVVATSIVGVARSGVPARLPERRRTRGDLVIGVAAVLGLYALTATLRAMPDTVGVTLCSCVALLIWRWWDPSRGALAIAIAAAVLGPLAEIAIVAIGASRYAEDSSELFGVASWLPCLYFAAGAVASGLWRVIERDGAD